MPDYKKLTIPRIKVLLDERGVEYPKKCKKADLVKLAEESEETERKVDGVKVEEGKIEEGGKKETEDVKEKEPEAEEETEDAKPEVVEEANPEPAKEPDMKVEEAKPEPVKEPGPVREVRKCSLEVGELDVTHKRIQSNRSSLRSRAAA